MVERRVFSTSGILIVSAHACIISRLVIERAHFVFFLAFINVCHFDFFWLFEIITFVRWIEASSVEIRWCSIVSLLAFSVLMIVKHGFLIFYIGMLGFKALNSFVLLICACFLPSILSIILFITSEVSLEICQWVGVRRSLILIVAQIIHFHLVVQILGRRWCHSRLNTCPNVARISTSSHRRPMKVRLLYLIVFIWFDIF